MKVKFEEIANFVAGQSPESKYYSNSHGTPFLQGNRTFGMLYPRIDTYTTRITKMAHKGDILMSVRAPVGDLNFAPCDLCIGRGLSSITAKDENNDFLFYALKYNIKALLNQSNGTTYDAVTGDVIKQMDMVLPDDIESRKNISKLLHSIDEKMELNNSICSDFESMAKLLYDYWFVQFDFPDKNGKPYKSSGGKMVYNEELKREIPEGWEVKPFGSLASMGNGINYDKNEEGDKNYRIVNVRNISSSSLLMDVNDFDTISLKKSQAERYLVQQEDILIARSGCPGSIRLIYNEHPDVIYCGFIIHALPNNPAHRLYLALNLKQYEGTNATKTGGSILQNVSQDTLSRVMICIPPDSIIEQYNQSVANLFEKMDLVIEENQQLTSLRDFLLPMLMNGQVKLSGQN